MKPLPFLLLTAGLLLAPVAGLRAQTARPVSVTFTILTYGMPGPAASYQNGGAFTPVKLPNAKRSPEYKYTGPAALNFYATASIAAGKPVPVAKAALPAATPRVLLVFVSSGDGYSVGVLADDGKALPPGKARIYNASSGPVSVNYNFATTVVLQPLESKVVDSLNGQVAVEVSVPGPDGKLLKQVNNGWPLPADLRREIFILNGEAFKGMDIAQRAIQMFSPEEAKAPTRVN
jgi:PPE-repeat protein